jgi:photosystem II stability/assembly factor-like uncharacterized protein
MSRAHALLLMALVAVCCSGVMAADIFWKPDVSCPAGDPTQIMELSFKNKDGMAAMQNGHVWITRDRGDTWTDVDLAAQLGQPAVRLTAVSMRQDRAIVAGLVTMGGGAEVTRKTAIAGDGTAITIEYGEPGPPTSMMAYSADGGATWGFSSVQGMDGIGYWHIAAIHNEWAIPNALAVGYYFPPGEEREAANRGYHLSRPLVLYTEDGGANWRKVGEPNVPDEDCIDLTGARVRMEGDSWICGHGGALYTGRPPFDTWTPATYPDSESRPRLTSMYSLDDRFWVTRADGRLMWWQDGAWDMCTVAPGAYLQDAVFLTNRDGVVISYTGVFHTIDGGSTWEQHQLPPDLFSYEFDCLRCVGVFSRHSLDDEPLFSYRVGAQHPGPTGAVEPCLLKAIPIGQVSPKLVPGLKLQRFMPLVLGEG